MSFICTKRRRRKAHLAGLARALAGLGLLVLGLRAQAQVTVQTIGGGPRINSCATWVGFAGGNTYTNAQFNDPYASALDLQGNLWVADTGNSDVEEISQAGNLGAEHHHRVENREQPSSIPPSQRRRCRYRQNVDIMMPASGHLLKYDHFLNLLSEILFTDPTAIPVASALAVDGSSNVFMAFTNGMIVSFRLVDAFPAPVYTNSLVSEGQLPMHTVVSSFPWRPVALALRGDGQLAASDTLSNAIYLITTNDDSKPHSRPEETGPDGGMARRNTPNSINRMALRLPKTGAWWFAIRRTTACASSTRRTTQQPFTGHPATSGRPLSAITSRHILPGGWMGWRNHQHQRIGARTCQRHDRAGRHTLRNRTVLRFDSQRLRHGPDAVGDPGDTVGARPCGDHPLRQQHHGYKRDFESQR